MGHYEVAVRYRFRFGPPLISIARASRFVCIGREINPTSEGRKFVHKKKLLQKDGQTDKVTIYCKKGIKSYLTLRKFQVKRDQKLRKVVINALWSDRRTDKVTTVKREEKSYFNIA